MSKQPAMIALDFAQYRALAEHSATLIWRAGLDEKCDYFNANWLAYTGRTLEQELGNGWAESVHAEDLQRCLATSAESFKARTPFEMEYRLRRADGVYRHILHRGDPYNDENGNFAGFIGSCTDIDEGHCADEAKRVFLTMIAHELRTPLMPLQSAPTLIRRRLKEGKDIEPLLASMERQVNRFARLVTSLSELPRLESGRPVSLDLARADVVELLRESVESHDAALGTRGTRRHSLTLEAPARPVMVLADPDRIRQVLFNLLENAIKYSPEGGAISIRCIVAATRVEISIIDKGIGIPAADHPRLMSRFFRASNASPERFPGVGLGLASSKEIAEAHGGELAIESEAGQGTRVTLSLPLDATAVAP